MSGTGETTGGPIRFGEDGLIPAVLQDATTNDVLMVGFMNGDALAATRSTGLVHFWSRSRAKLWQKGETSGNVSRVREIRVNCEQNSLLVRVDQVSAICHDGYATCYYRRLDADDSLTVVETRVFDPADVYGGQTAGTGGGQRADPATTIRTWYGAYEYLRDHDLSGASSTSARLRGDSELSARVADELKELAGVLDGSHRHEGLDADLRLEGGQVLYWLALVAVRAGLSAAEAGFEDGLLGALVPGYGDHDVRADVLLGLAARWGGGAGSAGARLVRSTVAAVVATLAAGGVIALDLVTSDAESLAGREYLEPYFAGRD